MTQQTESVSGLFEIKFISGGENVTEKIKAPKYPDDFFEYPSGKMISNEKINEWIEFLCKQLEDGLYNDFNDSAEISSGGVLVRVTKADDKAYQVEVNKNRFECQITYN